MNKVLKTTLLSSLMLGVIGLSTLLMVVPANAADIAIDPSSIGYTPTVKSASNGTIATIMNGVYLIAGMIAVLIIVIAGIMFVTSNGDSNRVSQAKQAILGSVIGLVLIMFAFVITQFVIGRVAG
jgi:hypothetical protein